MAHLLVLDRLSHNLEGVAYFDPYIAKGNIRSPASALGASAHLDELIEDEGTRILVYEVHLFRFWP